MKREKPATINLVMQLLKVVEVVEDSKVSVVLIVLHSLIFLRIFLVTSAGAPLEGQVIEEMI